MAHQIASEDVKGRLGFNRGKIRAILVFKMEKGKERFVDIGKGNWIMFEGIERFSKFPV